MPALASSDGDRCPKNSKPLNFYCCSTIYKRVLGHVLGNIAGDPRTPLTQLWYSEPGTGKTFGLLGIYRALEVRVFPFDAVNFENFQAGGPGRMLRDCFDEAQRALAGEGGEPEPVVVLVNDVDQGIGHPGGLIQHTVNRQHFQVVLMDLADRFTAHGRRRIPRPGIVMTANRPDFLHGPMIRTGRAEVLPWEYGDAERREIIRRMYPYLNADEVAPLLARFRDEPLAFFASLKRRLQVQGQMLHVETAKAKQQLKLALQGKFQFPEITPPLADLIAAGERLQHERRGLVAEVEVLE